MKKKKKKKKNKKKKKKKKKTRKKTIELNEKAKMITAESPAAVEVVGSQQRGP